MALPPAYVHTSPMADAASFENDDLSGSPNLLLNMIQQHSMTMHGSYQQPEMAFDACFAAQNSSQIIRDSDPSWAGRSAPLAPTKVPSFAVRQMEAALPQGRGWAEDESGSAGDWRGLRFGRGDLVGTPTAAMVASSLSEATTLSPCDNLETTLMVRNIPARYSKVELAREFRLGEICDFLYLPGTCGTKMNHSYAFVNFKTPSLAKEFVQQWHKRRLTRFSAQKALNICIATVQGFEANWELVTKKRKGNHCGLDTCFCVPMVFGRSDPNRSERPHEPHHPHQHLPSVPAAAAVAAPNYSEYGLQVPLCQTFSF